MHPQEDQTKWLTFDEIKEMYERGECCLNMGALYRFELNPVPKDEYQDIIGQIAFQEQFFSGVWWGYENLSYSLLLSGN